MSDALFTVSLRLAQISPPPSCRYTDNLRASVVEETHVLVVEERNGSRGAAAERAVQGLLTRTELALLRARGFRPNLLRG